jgi:hypothetical protein
MIDLGSQQVIQHVHGGGEKGPHIRPTGPPAENLGEIGRPGPRISDQDHVSTVFQEVEIEEPEDAALALYPRFVVLEVKGVDAGLRVQAGEVEAALDGPAVAGFQFKISQYRLRLIDVGFRPKWMFKGGRACRISAPSGGGRSPTASRTVRHFSAFSTYSQRPG